MVNQQQPQGIEKTVVPPPPPQPQPRPHPQQHRQDPYRDDEEHYFFQFKRFAAGTAAHAPPVPPVGGQDFITTSIKNASNQRSTANKYFEGVGEAADGHTREGGDTHRAGIGKDDRRQPNMDFSIY